MGENGRTRIYVVRHAEARGNLDRIFHGQTDSDVTEKGLLQLEALAGYFKDIHLDAIYSSDLKRALTTAQYVNKYAGLEIHTDPRLREIHGGLWENVHFDELPVRFPESFRTWEQQPHLHKMPQGESMNDVYRRMVEAVTDIANAHRGQDVAIVSHGAAIRTLRVFALGLPLSRLNDMLWCENTAVTIIDFDENMEPNLTVNGDAGHISDELSTIRRQHWYLKLKEKEKCGEPQDDNKGTI